MAKVGQLPVQIRDWQFSLPQSLPAKTERLSPSKTHDSVNTMPVLKTEDIA